MGLSPDEELTILQAASSLSICALLRGHTDTVNAIKFFSLKDDPFLRLLSGSADHSIRVWQIKRDLSSYSEIVRLEGHSASINCIFPLRGKGLVASGAADGTIRLWRISAQGKAIRNENLQTLQLTPRYFPLTVALHAFDDSNEIALAVAGTRSIVQIFVGSSDGVFSHQVTLTGHEGWIRSLAFSPDVPNGEGGILLATASQDKYIRLWRISRAQSGQASSHTALLAALDGELSNKIHNLSYPTRSYTVTFEALLLGHDDWIYTVSWTLSDRGLRLLSASEDSSLAVWGQQSDDDVWIPVTRLGEISGLKGSTTATGSAGGFWAGLWGPSGKSIVSLGRTGSWRIWNFDEAAQKWIQGPGITGHSRAITDIAWPRNGSYLLSTSSDQTTRLHAEWKSGAATTWHEISRPQIHGYDLNCIDTIGDNDFVSGADEKLLRVFRKPQRTAAMLDQLSGTRSEDHGTLPSSASIPVLGLSNKAGEQDAPAASHKGEDQRSESPAENGHGTIAHVEPPTEDHLGKLSLWPEWEKLYGHGHEISAVAVTNDGCAMATSCKASSEDHAVVRIYTTHDWREIKPPLKAHSLTVTALRFSPDDEMLLSVGRDRQWALWRRQGEPHDGVYALVTSNPKGHSRMILSACWAPLQAGLVFATAGRDKVVKVWAYSSNSTQCVVSIPTDTPVTAIDATPRVVNGSIVLAVGMESGKVSLYHVEAGSWNVSRAQDIGLE